MTSSRLICRMKTYIQPFERRLALMELEAVADAPAVPVFLTLNETSIFQVNTSKTIERLADSLTYWEIIGPGDSSVGLYTRQVKREATVAVVRNGISPAQLRQLLPFNGKGFSVPGRRVLRYGPHGAHEYRGKFFPQLVSALLNIAQLKENEMVLDPMCGSGTTPVEASLRGYRTIGLDINPLSVLMSQVKCGILRVSPEILASEYDALRADILEFQNNVTQNGGMPWLEHLPEKDRIYLQLWFSPRVLTALDPIAVRIHAIANATCRDFFRLCLSNILRRVSWQKDDDLRVRKEISSKNVGVLDEFIAEIDRTTRTILAFLYEERLLKLGSVQIIESDARYLIGDERPLDAFKSAIATVITSPPYATALPYLDTDRLSLCYLGLLPRSQHRSRDYEMIGNREISDVRRRDYWSLYQGDQGVLPEPVRVLINRIHCLNETADVGFRRRNLAALLSRYFFDMRQVLYNVAQLLMPGAPAYFVIGNNHTIAGNQRIEIETDQLLGMVGESVGLILEQAIPMEMLVSRDIFKKNSGASESILCFRKPS